MNRTNKLMRGIFVWLMLVATAATAYAAEAARMPNYDRWKDLPSQTLLDMGNAYWQVDKADSALVCFTILSNRYNQKQSQKEKRIFCGATTAAGSLYAFVFYDYQTAYQNLLKAEKIATENHFNKQLANINEIMVAIECIQMDIKNNFDYKPAVLELLKKAFHKDVDSDDYYGACVTFENMAYYAMKHQQINEIASELQMFCTLEIPDSIGFRDFNRILCDAVLEFRDSKYLEALILFAQLDNNLERKESQQRIAIDRCMIRVFKYVTLLSLHRDVEALKELDKAEEIALENQLNDAIVELHRMKQKYYLARGNVALAKEFEIKFLKTKDEFINRSKLLSVEQQQFLFELEQMGEEVKDLEAQKRMRDLIILGIALFALLVIGALVFLWRNYQSTKQRNLLLFQKNQELLALEAQEKERKAQLAEAKKYKSSPMDDPAKGELLQRLYDIMENNTQIYDEGFTLDQLASLVGSNPNYVSQVINEKKGCNFNTFVNEYRIKEACRRLSDTEQYGGLTIEAIGQSLGFKSRTNFTAIFKRFTGMTPAAYQRMARNGAIPTPSSK